MKAPSGDGRRVILLNRRALRDYSVLEKIEAGIDLRGTEVKSVRAGEVSLAGAYALVAEGSVTLYGARIAPYGHGNRFNHDPERPRRLLLHGREIERLRGHGEEKGRALIPIAVYLRRGLVKVELGVCKGKTFRDKRETLRRRTAERETERALAARRGG